MKAVLPVTPRKALGNAAERAAAAFLKAHGYAVLARNFSTQAGEIDIIAADGDTLCFVEVKSRTSEDFAPPHSAVDRQKQTRMRKAAYAYLVLKRLHDRLCRFDVLSLVPDPEQKSGWNIQLLRDAF